MAAFKIVVKAYKSESVNDFQSNLTKKVYVSPEDLYEAVSSYLKAKEYQTASVVVDRLTSDDKET